MSNEFIAFIVLVGSVLIYKNRKKFPKPSFSGGSEPLLKGISVLATAITIFVILSYALPQFENALDKLGISLFTATIIGGVISLIIWLSNFYYRDLHSVLFGIIVVLFLWNFSSIPNSNKNTESQEVNFQIQNLENGQVYYAKTPFSGKIKFRYVITPEIGEKVRVEISNPYFVTTLRGGDDWDANFPTHHRNAVFTITAVK